MQDESEDVSCDSGEGSQHGICEVDAVDSGFSRTVEVIDLAEGDCPSRKGGKRHASVFGEEISPLKRRCGGLRKVGFFFKFNMCTYCLLIIIIRFTEFV